MFDNPTKVEHEERGEVMYLSKEDLVGSTVVVQLKEYDPEFIGQHGPTTRAICDLYVFDGTHAGTLQADSHFFGNLASQLSQIGVGQTSVCIFQTGKSKRGGSWFGASFGIDNKQYDKALKAAQAAADKPMTAAAPF